MDDKLNKLIRATLAKTASGAIVWDAFDAESFRARIGNGSLHVQRDVIDVVDENERTHPATKYAMQVSDAYGRTVTEFDAVGSGEDFRQLQSLFESARKSALRSDAVIDGMIDSLQTSGIGG